MVDRKELIGLIRDLLKRNEDWLRSNPVGPQLERLRQLENQLRRETERTESKNPAAIERLETRIKAAKWGIHRWNSTAKHTQARREALKEIDVAVECQANQGLPTELVEKYF
jgi:hypothetical protein